AKGNTGARELRLAARRTLRRRAICTLRTLHSPTQNTWIDQHPTTLKTGARKRARQLLRRTKRTRIPRKNFTRIDRASTITRYRFILTTSIQLLKLKRDTSTLHI